MTLEIHGQVERIGYVQALHDNESLGECKALEEGQKNRKQEETLGP